MSDSFWMRLFLLAAIFNVLVGLPLLIDPTMVASPLPLPEGSWLFVRMAGACIVTFGIGYALVATDPDQYRSLVIVGAIGKLIVFGLLAIYWLGGQIRFGSFILGFIDLAFAILFIRFLLRYPAR